MDSGVKISDEDMDLLRNPIHDGGMTRTRGQNQ